MKTILFKSLLVGLGAFIAQPAFAIVGYYNVWMQPGVNLVANQLNNTINGNSLNSILSQNYSLMDGASFTKWNGNAFLTPSIYDATTDSWSINYTLNFGEGGYLITPTLFTNTFVGEVAGYAPVGPTPWTPNYADGLHLIASPVPVGGNLNLLFGYVVGRAPVEGEGVAVFNPIAQSYSFNVFMSGSWYDENLNLSTANLSVGQAAWFALGADLELGAGESSFGIPIVPEPTIAALLFAGGMAWLAVRNKNRHS